SPGSIPSQRFGPNDRPKRVSGGRMALLHRLASIVRWLVHRNRVEQDLNDELQAFVDMALADRMRDGVPPGDARRLAILHLGGVEQTKERVRSARCGAWLDQIARDVRDGLRQVRRNPAFSAIAIATLALGIGVNTAMLAQSMRYSFVRCPMSMPTGSS